MKKIVLFIAALLFMAVPVMAVSTVDITCNAVKVDDVNWVTVSYSSDTNRIRAFGLDITVSNPADGNIVQVVVLDPCGTKYRIYPGQISFIDGDINSTGYGTPYALSDLNDANLTIEMGSLYTTDPCYASDPNAGYNKIPGKSGDLLKFGFKNACAYTVDVNVRRGGIVMEDPYEMPSIDSPLCSGTIPDCGGPPPPTKDFGDAPQTYSTLMADVPPGPNHTIAGPILGVLVDGEVDGQPSVNCTGDGADEDGVLFGQLIINETGTVTVTVTNGPGILNAWIDWNNDGSFAQPIDALVFNEGAVVNTGVNVRTFPVPGESLGLAEEITLYSRWRISTGGTPDYYGPAGSGEVEDYHNPADPCQRLWWHVPDVVGEPNAVALAALYENGLKVTIVPEVNCVAANDTVIRTEPPYCTYPDNNNVNMVVAVHPPVPGAASNPIPVTFAKCVNTIQVLSWTPGAGTATQDVYFSYIFSDVNTMQPPAFRGNVPVGTTTYDPVPDMNVYTLYYWRIVEKNVCNETTIGPVWCLATGAVMTGTPLTQKPCCNNETSNCLGNINTDTRVNLTDYGLLVNFITPLPSNRCTTAVGSGTCPPCYDINGSGRVDITDLGELVNKLSKWTANRHTCPYPSCSNPP